MKCSTNNKKQKPCKALLTWEESQANTLKMYKRTGNLNAFNKHVEHLRDFHHCTIEYSTSNIDYSIRVTRPNYLF